MNKLKPGDKTPWFRLKPGLDIGEAATSMSIPHSKQRGIAEFIRNHGPESITRIPEQRQARPSPAARPSPVATQQAPRSPVKTAGPAALLMLMVGVVMVGLVPDVEAQAGCVAFEDFEDDTNFQPPTDCWYTTQDMETAVVDTTMPYEGTKSFHSIDSSPIPRFTVDPEQFACQDGIVAELEFYFRLDTLPSSLWFGGFSTPTTLTNYIQVGSTGTVTIVTPGGSVVPNGGTDFVDADVWYGTTQTLSCNSGTLNDDFTGVVWEADTPTNVIGASISDYTATSGTLQAIKFQATGTGPVFWIDNLAISPYNQGLESNQIAVTGLVGGSMDATGQHIVTRETGGTTVSTYATADLTQSATVASTCTRDDGVVTTSINGEIWVTYADCDSSPTVVDTLRIRTSSLGIPLQFANDCNGEPEEDIVDGEGNIAVPNNMAQLGTLSDLSYDYEECINPPGFGDGAFAGWTFSSSFDGWIGAYAVGYGSNIGNGDQENSHEEHAPAIDTGGAPLEVNDFCSWTGPDNNDYIGGVSSGGVAAVYRVEREIDLNEDNAFNWGDIDFTFQQMFRNAGPYAGSIGIACAGDIVAIQTPLEIRILDNITSGFPALIHQFPNVATVERGLAMPGSSEFLFYHDGTTINVFDIATGNTTGSVTAPGGTWVSMESDFAGQTLAIFTSDFITVVEASPATCEINNNCEELGGIGDDDAGPGPGPTTTGAPGGQDFGENIEDNVYFWIILWIVVVVVGLALLSWGTRAGFSGLVYMIGVSMVYIAAILLNNYDGGTVNVSPWPIAAMAAISIGLAVTWWVRR